MVPGVPVPGDGLGETVLETDLRLEAETLLRASGVELSSGLAVRARRVPADLALEPAEPRDELGEVLDGDLESGPQVHRFRGVVALGRKQDALGGVAGVQEL